MKFSNFIEYREDTSVKWPFFVKKPRKNPINSGFHGLKVDPKCAARPKKKTHLWITF